MTALLIILALLLSCSASVKAAPDLSKFAYQQMLGNQVSLDATFHDATGRSVRLGGLFADDPVILVLGYFHCPTLCGVVRDDLMNALSRSGLLPDDYTLVLLSIDPVESDKDARSAKQQDAVRAGFTRPPPSWHYLTGAADNLKLIERDVGFRSRFDPALKQFLHPAGIIFLTPNGTVSSYLLGVGYKPGDVRLGVERARTGSVAQAVTPVLLLCFHYDPSTGRYTLSILKLLEIACVLTLVTVGALIALAFHRERQS